MFSSLFFFSFYLYLHVFHGYILSWIALVRHRYDCSNLNKKKEKNFFAPSAASSMQTMLSHKYITYRHGIQIYYIAIISFLQPSHLGLLPRSILILLLLSLLLFVLLVTYTWIADTIGEVCRYIISSFIFIHSPAILSTSLF